jgi:uncharacterized membrane protein
MNTIHDHLSAAENFQKENGMTLDQAWEKVKEWNLGGKIEEAKRGCKIILEFFPEHDAKNLLEHLESQSASSAPSFKSEEIHGKKKSLAQKWGEKFADTVEGVLKKKKEKKEIAASTPEVSVPQTSQTPLAGETPQNGVPSEAKTELPAQGTSPEMFPETKPEFVPPKEPVLDDERLMGALSYAWIFCLIPLFTRKESAFVQFHAWQGVIIAMIFTILPMGFGKILSVIPLGLGYLVHLFFIIAMCFAAYKAYQGEYWKIPGIYKLSEKLKGNIES